MKKVNMKKTSIKNQSHSKNHREHKISIGSVCKGIAIAAALTLGVTACGSMNNLSASDTITNDSGYKGDDYGYDYGYSTNSYDMTAGAVEQSADYAEEVYYDEDGNYEMDGSSGLQTIQEENQGAKLIRTVYLSLDTENFEDVVTLVEQKTNQAGGYIQSSELYDYSYGRNQDIVVRIPYEKVDEFLDGIDVYGTITHKSDYIEDVTLQYSDVETHIENLETQHKRLLELLEQAENLEDIITLNEQLTTVETELDSYKKQIRNYDNLISYSTVSISIREQEYVTPTEDRTIGGRITSGLAETMYNLKTFFSNLLVWFVVSLPVLLIIAVIIVIIVIVIKAIVKKHKKKKTMKQQALGCEIIRNEVIENEAGEVKPEESSEEERS